MAFKGMYDNSEKRGGHEGRDEKGKYRDRKEGGENIKFDQKYRELAEEVLEETDPRSRETAGHILSSREAYDMYKDWTRLGASPGDIKIFLKHALPDIAKGRKEISAQSKLRAYDEAASNASSYIDALRTLCNRHYITSEEFEAIAYRVKGHQEELGRAKSSAIEEIVSKESKKRVAAVWIFIVSGFLIMMLSGFAVTGGVIGKTASPTMTFVLGFILFVIGLLMKK